MNPSHSEDQGETLREGLCLEENAALLSISDCLLR